MCKKRSTQELDLHGKTHAEARIAVEEYILLNEPPLTIVTGNSIKMQEIVQELLKKYNLKSVELGPKIIAG